MSQLNVPLGLRAVRDGVLKLLDISWYDAALKLTISLLVTAILWTAWSTGALFDRFLQLYSTRLGAALMTLGIVYSFFTLAITLIRAGMVFRYRPMKSLDDTDLPTVSVIIPAYNEGPDVARSIDSIARSNYPRAKLQIIAVDDGSADDTWLHMQAAAHRHPDLVCAIRMEHNGGKRQGLRVGFALAAGDVLVTMDSDSIVDRDSLRSLVTPIAVDRRIGAVAGNVKVLNRSAGILPRMMRASFVLAFDFTRAYQSQIRSVLCTPGAFSAYRRSAVETVLDDWIDQTWMGKPSTIAEDRALSNLVLREGHEIVFQSDAVVWTNVPTTYRQMARMYQRWERGNLRENLTYATFCWKPFRKRFRAAANIEWALSVCDMFIPSLLIAASLAYGIFNPFFLLKYLAFIIIFSAIMQGYYWHKERDSDFLYGILYGLFWFTCLWWVVPYSVLTAGNGSWMTRTIPSCRSEPLPQPANTPQGPRLAA